MAEQVLTGGCLCGAVRFETRGEPVVTAHCHCLDCRKASGAGHITLAAFPQEAVSVSGTLKTYSTRADSGKLSARSFCPVCGSWVIGAPERMPDIVALNLAMFDDPEVLTPQMRFYDKRRLSWDAVDPDLPAFETVPQM